MLAWLIENAWVVWFAVAAILAVTEVAAGDFTLLMLASGALAGGVAALVFPGLWLVQVLVAVFVAVLMLAILRPTLLKRVREAPGYRSSLDKLIGSTGPALTAITATTGEVKLGGEVWSARSYDGGAIDAGVQVEVYDVDGTVVRVYPKDHNPELR